MAAIVTLMFRAPIGVAARSAKLVRALGVPWHAVGTLAAAALAVFLMEAIARSSITGAWEFVAAPHGPALGTVLVLAAVLLALDAAFGRALMGFVVLAPLCLALAWADAEKIRYLGDPLYPSDFLYARQIVDLMPLLAGERPTTAIAAGVCLALLAVALILCWRMRARIFPPMGGRGRLWRAGIALPALVFFATTMDYASFSWVRDRLKVRPMMWDQRANYDHNGLVMAFALNVPMANVQAPRGYSEAAMARITGAADVRAASVAATRPDVILVMSESFWDPDRLPGISITPDPIPTVRSMQSGHVFSPEFGGMTANVEFEALTGFSNAFLPYGSIPYQQYVRRPVPSLATFFRDRGYATRAIHPFRAFFWNRGNVYKAFGFDAFLSEERLPPLKKRGTLASDEALVEEIIREAERTAEPFFFFAVTLQSHGPYRPGRYEDESLTVDGAPDARTAGAIASFAEGMADADRSFARLVEWAGQRERPTIIGFFGDHLPPLGQSYVRTGLLAGPVAKRTGTASTLGAARETPLVLWSNRHGGRRGVGTISPVFLPLHILRMAGMDHPYYTGFLGDVHARYNVIDRHLLIGQDGVSYEDWQRRDGSDPAIRDFRLLQYDMLFGNRYASPAMFEEMQTGRPRSRADGQTLSGNIPAL